ncbi:MAG: succinate dehydrogenase, cytochrome b556 subunit [Gallionellales bacterium RIFOXYB12_FULL_54_9]|nr:MAG: succinate dehydrogenase, cytochrome b556 subunit [Gallionellales bacterium RIFOXYB12_FULL_54_9]
MKKQRPKHLALHLIKLPLPGFISILHRVSGLALFLALPLLLLALQYSLRASVTYQQLQEVLAHPLAKLLMLGLLWSFLHHLCAGIRYLAIDLHYISNLKQARGSSKVVLAVSLLLTIFIGVKLW